MEDVEAYFELFDKWALGSDINLTNTMKFWAPKKL